jgi:hypothetical protein
MQESWRLQMNRRKLLGLPAVAAAGVLAARMPESSSAEVLIEAAPTGLSPAAMGYFTKEYDLKRVYSHWEWGDWYEWRVPSLGPYMNSIIYNPSYPEMAREIRVTEWSLVEGEVSDLRHYWHGLVRQEADRQVGQLEAMMGVINELATS